MIKVISWKMRHFNINIKTEKNKLDYKYFWASDHLETKTESDIPENLARASIEMSLLRIVRLIILKTK